MAALPQAKRVLVLGASGKLGRMLGLVWESDAHRDFVRTSRSDAAGCKKWAPDQDTESLGRADAIVALWGVTSGDAAALQANQNLAIQAMKLGAAVGAKRILHCSSAAVYEPGDNPLPETAKTAPLHPYGKSKLEMERVVTGWAAQNPQGPKPCLMRIANVVGADSLFGALGKCGDITLDQFDDGEGPQRSYVTISDLAQCLDSLLGCALTVLPTIVNVATPGAVAMADLVSAAGRNVIWKPAPATAVPKVELSIDRLLAVPKLDLKPQSAADMIADWRRWKITE